VRRLLSRSHVVKENLDGYGGLGLERLGGLPIGMADSGDDRRSDLRVPLILRIDHPGLPPQVDTTENLSAGGMFVRTDRRLPVGTRAPLLLSFPGLLEPLELEVEVVWARRAEGALPAGVAVRIPEDRLADREKLARLARAAEAPAPAERTYRILLVEDNALIASMYEATMRKLRSGNGRVEVAVEQARDGLEALARLQRKPRLDLIVADLYMPVMDGFTLVERVRSDLDVMMIPILAISAGGEEARARALQAGVDVYLAKPVKFAEVVGTVRALLHMS
jgi:uncharacterized protein (TIGR02266 family)